MGVSVLPAVGFLPGMVMAYAGPTTPPGWLLCDGSLLNIVDYPALYAAIGTSYNIGGESATQFRLPNLKGKIIVQQDVGQTEFAVLGAAGGSKISTAPHSHSLSAHTHGVTTGSPSNNTSDGPSNNTSGTPSDNTSDWPGPNNTGWMDRNNTHQHEFNSDGNIYAQVWTTSTSHSHQGGGGTTSEQPWGGGAWATNHYHHGFTDWRDINHLHDLQNHTHGMKNHSHSLSSHTHTMAAHTHSATSAVPNNDITGASSAALTSGNLQPYLTMNYVIKV